MKVSVRRGMRRPLQGGHVGATVVEAVVSVAVIGIALGALMTLNGNQLRLVKVARETNSASLVVQERVERLRTLRWPDLVDSNFMTSNFLSSDAKAAPILENIAEEITISPFPGSGTATAMKLRKQSTAAATVISGGSGLADEKLVRVDLKLEWKAANGKTQKREISTLLAKSGVNRNDIPAMGPVSGGPFDVFEPPVDPDPSNPAPEDPTPTDPTPSPGNGNNGNGNGNGNGNNGNGNGIGNGNGNVNGKPGKG